MGFWKNIKHTMTNITFKGRSTRKEFIHYILFSLLYGIITGIFCFFPICLGLGMSVAQTGKLDFANISTGFIIYAVISLLVVIIIGLWMFIANIALYVRRLHDMNYSGWAYFIYCVIVFVISCGPNKYYNICSTITSIMGLVVMIYLMSAKGTEGTNKYGEAKITTEATPDSVQEAE